MRYPKAGTLADAKQLRASILAEQAKRGDGRAGLEIAAGAQTLKSETRCPNEDDDMRLTALAGIIQLDPDQVLPVVQKLLERKDECSIKLRKRAVYLIAQTREEERADVLLRVASTDPSPEVRREAVQWLSSVNTERAAKALDSILFHAVDADTRDRALNSLAQRAQGRGQPAQHQGAGEFNAIRAALFRHRAIFRGRRADFQFDALVAHRSSLPLAGLGSTRLLVFVVTEYANPPSVPAAP